MWNSCSGSYLFRLLSQAPSSFPPSLTISASCPPSPGPGPWCSAASHTLWSFPFSPPSSIPRDLEHCLFSPYSFHSCSAAVAQLCATAIQSKAEKQCIIHLQPPRIAALLLSLHTSPEWGSSTACLARRRNIMQSKGELSLQRHLTYHSFSSLCSPRSEALRKTIRFYSMPPFQICQTVFSLNRRHCSATTHWRCSKTAGL